eukprot:9231534-Alexandrium_andersonii.AAC.1
MVPVPHSTALAQARRWQDDWTPVHGRSGLRLDRSAQEIGDCDLDRRSKDRCTSGGSEVHCDGSSKSGHLLLLHELEH